MSSSSEESLSANSSTISSGISYGDILTKGTFFFPAIHRYAHDRSITQVVCDRCFQNNLQTCIGYQQYDLCLRCVDILAKNRRELTNPIASSTTSVGGNSPYAPLDAPFPLYSTTGLTGRPEIVVTRMVQDMFTRKVIDTGSATVAPSLLFSTSSSSTSDTMNTLPPINTILPSTVPSQYDTVMNEFIQGTLQNAHPPTNNSNGCGSSSSSTIETTSSTNSNEYQMVPHPRYSSHSRMQQNIFRTTRMRQQMFRTRMRQSMYHDTYQTSPILNSTLNTLNSSSTINTDMNTSTTLKNNSNNDNTTNNNNNNIPTNNTYIPPHLRRSIHDNATIPSLPFPNTNNGTITSSSSSTNGNGTEKIQDDLLSSLESKVFVSRMVQDMYRNIEAEDREKGEN